MAVDSPLGLNNPRVSRTWQICHSNATYREILPPLVRPYKLREGLADGLAPPDVDTIGCEWFVLWPFDVWGDEGGAALAVVGSAGLLAPVAAYPEASAVLAAGGLFGGVGLSSGAA